MAVETREMTAEDYAEVARIYRDGIATDLATFETEVPDWGAWDAAHLERCRVVAVDGSRVVGWAALSPVSERCVYGGVGEVSVYVDAAARGQGVGRRLLTELVTRSEAEGLWTLQAGVFSGNEASIRLHERCGFRVVGTRERLGQLKGEWKDVVLLERRSPTVG